MLRNLNQKIRRSLAKGRLSACGREGFTLVEIMMVMVILTVGVLPVAVIQHRARQEVSESDRYTQAIELAQLHLERMKGMGFGGAVGGQGQAGQISWVSTVTNVSFGLDRITVTATWRNDNADQTLTVSDLVSLR